MDKLKLSESLGEVSWAADRAAHPEYILLLSHGAGAGYAHPFLKTLADSISKLNGTVIRFNFPYMEQGKKFPGSPKVNIRAVGHLVAHLEETFPGLPVFLSGKSYGGRMSSHWVAENPESTIHGLVYFGFPLHAPGKPAKSRAEHLYSIRVPQLFIQGTNDALADYQLIGEVTRDCQNADLITISHGDHSFKVPKKQSSQSHHEIIQSIAEKTNEWSRKIL